MQLPLLKDANVGGKTVFLRVDLDVPLSEIRNPKSEIRDIEDDTRLKSALPTVEYLLKQNCKIIVAGHLGRPKGIDKSLSFEPVARWFFKEFKIRNSKFEFKLKIKNLKFTKLASFEGWEIGQNIFLLENLRFYEEEEANDLEFAKKLASLADIYVNDAFAVCHRNNASVVYVPKYLPHFAGFRLQEEVKTLSSVLENPKRPLVIVIGGAKIETKVPLVEKMYNFADYVLVGGKIARERETLLKISNNQGKGNHTNLIIGDLNDDKTDITNKSVNDFLEIIQKAKTVVWNGPVGQISNKDSEHGTLKLAEGIVKSDAYTVVGGGDTLEFLRRMKLIDKFSFASTGGGAMLSFLSNQNMPGLTALTIPN